ncbi:glycosyltransferase family 2 protein [uncultured Muriicola sp.]|uniref:glycosyltransferase family 2 protein n=1 Tax=uncultured Muriicola sp. TaxID=1583102 RepID=UPI0026224867|nr:glycosyltransferase family 2 protein [uncultured Muriicola sp.]
MNYYIVIPAHNEEAFLEDALQSIIKQSLAPKKVVIVNDNSSDGTANIIDEYASRNPFIKGVHIQSSDEHLPGSKVIAAFSKGLPLLDEEYDFIVKLDADVILPPNYFKKIETIFSSSEKIGIAGGFAYEKNNDGEWALNHPMDIDHVRGAFKSYSKACFKAIGGLRIAMGWDTVDELLAQYYGFQVVTDTSLKVKHQRPIGAAYNSKARRSQGKAMYLMHYGLAISLIASVKMAWKNKKIKIIQDNFLGYWEAKQARIPFIVTEKEGQYIRELRRKRILKKLF